MSRNFDPSEENLLFPWKYNNYEGPEGWTTKENFRGSWTDPWDPLQGLKGRTTSVMNHDQIDKVSEDSAYGTASAQSQDMFHEDESIDRLKACQDIEYDDITMRSWSPDDSLVIPQHEDTATSPVNDLPTSIATSGSKRKRRTFTKEDKLFAHHVSNMGRACPPCCAKKVKVILKHMFQNLISGLRIMSSVSMLYLM